MISFARSLPLTMPLLIAVGCGGSGAEFPTTQVVVTVTYQDRPVEAATVTFFNDSHGKPVLAVGRTDANGVAKMRTYADDDGAIRGPHQVTIMKSEMAQSQAGLADVESDEYDPDAAARAGGPAKSLIPAKYSTRGSGLTVEVGEEPTEALFALED